jgi:undecaprenyl diphosphate synthase
MDNNNNKIPRHIAFIMDGNRRWAKEKGMPIFLGHKNGAETFKKIINYSANLGVKIITAFAFSTENHNRPKDEVDYLMDLLVSWLDSQFDEMKKNDICFRLIGNRTGVSKKVLEKIEEVEKKTSGNKSLILNFAFNYGGRDELIRAMKKITTQNIKLDSITEELIEKNLDLAGLPDPDLIIRTSGEQRLSGFLPWNSAYSELYFPKVYWPDFDESELDKAIDEFNRRQRRFGR